MSRTFNLISKASAAALALALLAGCATTDDGSLKSAVDKAQADAAAAQAAANEAKAKAEAAMTAATDAKQMASRAEGIAKATQFQVDRQAKRQEQMFKKSMYK